MFSLTAKKIHLRALEPYDLDFLYSCENNTDNWRVSNTIAPFSKHMLKKYVDNSHNDIYTDKQLRLIIENIEQKKAIGIVDLFDFDPFHRRAGIGILIEKKGDRQKGYASQTLQLIINYAFEYMNLNQLYCNIDASNTSSQKLFFNVGFVLAGTKNKWLKTAEGWEDELLLQLINPNS